MRKIIFSLLLLACIITLNSCKKKIPGCTDSAATNYNSDANDDDGSCTYTPILTIGQSYQGGYIAYILQQGDVGYDANVKHGLIAATSDQGTTHWGCSGTSIGGTSTAFGTGQANTTAIVNACSEAGIAARLCNDLVLGGYSDWYLPSKDELNKLYINRVAIGGFASFSYWSSSENEYNATYYAWSQDFSNGSQSSISDKYYTGGYVRAVRAF